MAKKYVLFDRDGTLIEHVHHLSRVKDVRFYGDTAESLMEITHLGYQLGVVTNQSVIARGIATSAEVKLINDHIANFLSSHGVQLDFVLVCPHVPEDKCKCRKPNIGLGEQAVRNFDIDLRRSFMVGDQISDLEFGLRLGVTPVGVRNIKLRGLATSLFFENLKVFSNWLTNGG